ncbi:MULTISPECIES: CMD domain protein [unclassified Ensifer]|uniref:CMD domain protein n=1 Tax=unclassified Ensifer TaxID=2633371 RepID=UPI000813BC31|nr:MULTISPECIES: CMD domain protein [unclassified Ensifer]OCP03403.1 CMD domain protein [Ensifer sp. LC14]OCP03735.1 CMD domain protein [Ensifer sp. LC11]OCP03884.1 CMD domain protein [Ensifer sp. LC13]OCP30298.1 CMD domain protein [Ensifer sp. LC499]
MTLTSPDIIDLLAGITAGSALDRIRAQRPETREQAQKSYLSLFQPEDFGDVSEVERHAIASFVAGLHRQADIYEFYTNPIEEGGANRWLIEVLKAEIGAGRATGPYGNYPIGPLNAENAPGPTYRVSEASRQAIGRKLSAALEHAHLLVFHLRDANPQALQALLDAGWTTNGIVTLSQLVSFVAFQIRVIAGLSLLSTASKRAAA